ncbi:MAG: YihY/virulence factor BrkB family protein [Crocinitomicaceae bacterium]
MIKNNTFDGNNSIFAGMPLVQKAKRLARIFRAIYVRKFIHFARKVKIPGFQGVSLWEIIFFFLYSLRRGLIGMRAGAVAYQFFIAAIPFGLVLVVLTAYTPGIHIENDFAPVLSDLLPAPLVERILNGLHEYENSSVTSLISLGFVFALYFTSNGFTVLIKAFNGSKMDFAKRKWWDIRLVSMGFVITFIVGIVLTFYGMILVRKGFVYWAESSKIIDKYFDQIYAITDMLFLGFLIYGGIALIYYFGPRKRSRFKFFSPGATLAFVMVVIISLAYGYYITNFANYNALYGALGTVMMVLLWLYMMSFSILIGFELNASIHGAIQYKKLDNLEQLEKRYQEMK